jgi:nicotinamidase-related amidase
MATRRLLRPALFICDIQEKFRPAIHEFPSVISTVQKMLKASKILNIPVYVTTQNKARLGDTAPELPLADAKVLADKSIFSMCVPQIMEHFGTSEGPKSEIAIVGIESHICVTQTALDLLGHGHKVYVLADGVSSCNAQEIPIALNRLRREGAVVTTSESFLYECMGNAAIPEFRDIVALIRDSKQGTKSALEQLCKI